MALARALYLGSTALLVALILGWLVFAVARSFFGD
jgi:hypothetical protein